MNELFNVLAERQIGQDSVLMTVVASSGSTPRGVGARMLVSKEGRLVGTIGGGAIEYRCQQLAQEVLTGKVGKLEQFMLAPNDIADLGMICGGNAHVLFQYIPANESMAALCQRVLVLITSKSPAWLVAEIDHPTQGLSVYSQKEGWLGTGYDEIPVASFESGQAQVQIGERQFYVEPLVHPGRVFVFGGGHVSQALVPILSGVDFDCVVYEDRADFLREELFPTARELVLGQFESIDQCVNIGPEDYALVMTRGHQYDFLLQTQLLQTQARYIGVMGSQRKIAVQIDKLKAAGFTAEAIQRITMPIGLAIKAETPAELAISIAGQLIMERRHN